MSQSAIETILQRLRTNNAQDAWVEFLTQYSDHIYKIARLTTPDAELAADCYLHVCERLCANGYRRLLRFRVDGSAKFETWLSVVTKHLCFDCLRSRFGRKRLFRSLARLPQLESEVFRLRVEQGMTIDETVANLRPTRPSLTAAEVQVAEGRVHGSLSARQRWLLQQQAAERQQLSFDEESVGAIAAQLSDPHPSPEFQVLWNEHRDRLTDAMATLEPDERLIVRLRFAEDLTLSEIAKLTQDSDAQKVHYRLNQALAKLKKWVV